MVIQAMPFTGVRRLLSMSLPLCFSSRCSKGMARARRAMRISRMRGNICGGTFWLNRNETSSNCVVS